MNRQLTFLIMLLLGTIMLFSNAAGQVRGLGSYLAPGDHTSDTDRPGDVLLFGWTDNHEAWIKAETLLRKNHISYDEALHIVYQIWLDKKQAEQAEDLIKQEQKTDPSLRKFGIDEEAISKIK